MLIIFLYFESYKAELRLLFPHPITRRESETFTPLASCLFTSLNSPYLDLYLKEKTAHAAIPFKRFLASFHKEGIPILLSMKLCYFFWQQTHYCTPQLSWNTKQFQEIFLKSLEFSAFQHKHLQIHKFTSSTHQIHDSGSWIICGNRLVTRTSSGCQQSFKKAISSSKYT